MHIKVQQNKTTSSEVAAATTNTTPSEIDAGSLGRNGTQPTKKIETRRPTSEATQREQNNKNNKNKPSSKELNLLLKSAAPGCTLGSPWILQLRYKSVMPSRCLHVAAVQCWSTEGAMQVNRATFAEMCAKWSHGDDANVFFFVTGTNDCSEGNVWVHFGL